MKNEDVIQELVSGTVCPRRWWHFFLTAPKGQRGNLYNVAMSKKKNLTFQRTGWRDVPIVHCWPYCYVYIISLIFIKSLALVIQGLCISSRTERFFTLVPVCVDLNVWLSLIFKKNNLTSLSLRARRSRTEISVVTHQQFRPLIYMCKCKTTVKVVWRFITHFSPGFSSNNCCIHCFNPEIEIVCRLCVVLLWWGGFVNSNLKPELSQPVSKVLLPYFLYPVF